MVARRLYRERVLPAWLAFSAAVGDFFEEAASRVSLTWAVLAGRMPLEVERRWWNRSTETPALVDVYDWTTDRLIFSVLIWPSLETPADDADSVFHERVREVKEAIAKGATDKAWSTRLETDYGLRWDSRRQVWTGADGFAHEPPARRPDAA